MSDKRVLVISAIVLVAVIMGMSSVAIVLPQATATHGGPGVQIFWDLATCTGHGKAIICTTWIDVNDSGSCDGNDPLGKMSMNAITKLGLATC